MGDNVTVTGVSVTGYNGNFAVTAYPVGHHVPIHGHLRIGAGTGGFAAADTAQCGLVDADAALLNNGKVLIAGGDYIHVPRPVVTRRRSCSIRPRRHSVRPCR